MQLFDKASHISCDSIHIRLEAAILDSADREYFHRHRKFFWKALV